MEDFACPQTFICPLVFALFLMTTQLAVTQTKKADKLMQSHKKSIINIKQDFLRMPHHKGLWKLAAKVK
jgi:hypothetical protein